MSQLVVGAVAPRIQYVADGWQTEFPFPFIIFKPGDMEVYVGENHLTGGYDVDGVASADGGTVILHSPPPAHARVTLRRRLTLQRLTDFQEGGAIRARVLNDQLDFLTAALQELDTEVHRRAGKAPTAPDGVSVVLPPAVPGKAIGWSEDGLSLVNDPTDFTTTVQVVQQWATDAEGSVQSAHDAAATATTGATTAQAQAAAASAAAVIAEDAAGQAVTARDGAVAAGDQADAARRGAEAFAADAAFQMWTMGRERDATLSAVEAAEAAAALAEGRAAEALVRLEDTDIALWRAERAARRAEAVVIAPPQNTTVTGIGPTAVLPNWARIDT